MKWMSSLCVGLFLIGCGQATPDSKVSAAEQEVDLLEKAVGIVEGVTDKETATKARGELEKLAEQWKSVEAEKAKLPEPTQEQLEKLQKEFEPQIKQLQEKLASMLAGFTLKPEVLAEIGAVVKTFMS